VDKPYLTAIARPICMHRNREHIRALTIIILSKFKQQTVENKFLADIPPAIANGLLTTTGKTVFLAG
jgi:hypothetical protein